MVVVVTSAVETEPFPASRGSDAVDLTASYLPGIVLASHLTDLFVALRILLDRPRPQSRKETTRESDGSVSHRGDWPRNPRPW